VRSVRSTSPTHCSTNLHQSLPTTTRQNADEEGLDAQIYQRCAPSDYDDVSRFLSSQVKSDVWLKAMCGFELKQSAFGI